MRDAGVSLLDELQLGLLEVYAVRQDRVPAQEIELVVDGGVRLCGREERCRRRFSSSTSRDIQIGRASCRERVS